MVPRSSTAPSTCAVGSPPRTAAGDGWIGSGLPETSSSTTKSVTMMPIGRDDRDGELVESLRRRDAGAAECLVMTYQARAYRLAVGIRANAEDAEEVVQDALCSAIRSIDAFRGESAFGSWFYRIVVNSAPQKARRPLLRGPQPPGRRGLFECRGCRGLGPHRRHGQNASAPRQAFHPEPAG